MINPFHLSRIPEFYFGVGQFDQLPSLIQRYGKNVMIITGQQSFIKSKLWGKLIAEMSFKDIKYNLVKISGEPTVEMIDEIGSAHKSQIPDVIVAIGGGSVIDSGKAVSAMITLEDSILPYLEISGPEKKHSGHKIPFIALPTTSGTGSEATKNAVISGKGGLGFKSSLRHENLIPDVAIIDPKLTLNCPEDVTAASGMDALTQLIEGYLSMHSNSFTDQLALTGIEMIMKNIETVCAEPDHIEARTEMAYASFLSGIVLANTGLGLVHGFASSVGGYKIIPHGVICGTLLGAVNRMNISRLIRDQRDSELFNKYLKMAKVLGNFRMKTDEQILEFFAQEIDNKIRRLKIPLLGRYGIEFNDVEAIVEKTSLKNNAIQLSKEEISEIILERV